MRVVMTEEDATRKRVREILTEFKGHQGALLVALLHIQYEFGYTPEYAVEDASVILGVSQPEVWGVLSFYSDFKIGKQGDHFIDICVDGPCHIGGAPGVRRALEEAASNESNKFEVRAISCPGICAKAPVVAVDMRYHGDMTPDKALELAAKLD